MRPVSKFHRVLEMLGEHPVPVSFKDRCECNRHSLASAFLQGHHQRCAIFSAIGQLTRRTSSFPHANRKSLPMIARGSPPFTSR